MPEIGAARGVTKHTDLTNKEDAQGVIDHAAGSVTMAKLVQEVQDLINGALQKSGGTMTGNLTIEKAEPQLIFKEPLGIGVISTTLADEADIWVTTGGGFSVRTSNAAKSDYVDRLWIPGVTEIADIELLNSNLLLQAGRTVDGVDVSEHVAASPIDHPDASIRPVKLDAIDSPANTEVPSYDSATGKFEWVSVAGITMLQAKGTTDVQTTSTSWVDMPDMTLTFELSEAKNVLIIFSSTVLIDPINDVDGSRAVAMFKPVIDGSTQTGEGGTEVGFASITDINLDFLATPVHFSLMKALSAGEHTVKVQWRMDQGTRLRNQPTTAPELEHRRLIVQY